IAVTLLQHVLGDDENIEAMRHFEGRPQAGDAAADDEDVGEEVWRALGTEGNKIAWRGEHAIIVHRLAASLGRARASKSPLAQRSRLNGRALFLSRRSPLLGLALAKLLLRLAVAQRGLGGAGVEGVDLLGVA